MSGTVAALNYAYVQFFLNKTIQKIFYYTKK